MKNAIKKAISVLLVAVMVFGAAPLAGFVGFDLLNVSDIFNNKAEAATYGGTCGANLTWTLDTETGELTVSGTGDMWDWSWANKKTVPWYTYRSYIKSLIIGNGVTSIGDSAFNDCDGITNITISNNITSIGSRAFYQCEGLASVVIGNSVTNIDERAFWNCRKLSTVSIGKGVKIIGDRAFCACYSLLSIAVDSANTAYSNDAYGVLFNKSQTELIQYSLGAKRTSYTIPDSVTSIANGAFFGCEELASVKIGSNVNSMGEDSFQLCKNLTSITIPHGVTSIGKGVFGSCYNLKSITIPNSVKNIGDSAFANCSGLAGVYFSGTEAEWDSISVGNYNDELANATVYFNYVSEETTTKPAETTTKPTTTVPTTTKPAETTTNPTTTKPAVTTTKPTTTVPSTIRPWAEGKCGENLMWALYILSGNEKGELVISGTGDMFDWTSNSSVPWYSVSSYIESIIVSDGVTSIGDFAFSNLYYCKDAKLADGVKRIGKSAFSSCAQLENITIPDGITSIGESAFGSCVELENITIPYGVTSIGYRTFYYCEKLKRITIPYGVTSIGKSAFEYCKELENISIPDSVTNIGDRAFFGCEKLKSITIPYGVTSIGKCMFYGCCELTDVTIPDSVTSIGESAFNDCDISGITIPVSVTSIEYGAFHMSGVRDVYYRGTKEEWNRITIAGYNNSLINANIHFNYNPEETTVKPATTVPSTTKPATTKPVTTRPGTTLPVTENVTTIQIRTPSQTKINYGDSIILHARVNGEIPQGAEIVWISDNSNFAYDVSSGGMTCKVSPSVSGDTTFTASVIDANGNVICSDEQTMTSKAGFFQKIISFFKNLFGMNRTFVQTIFKGIY